jgi:hypothetical protein
MATKKDVVEWDNELHKLAKSYGERDQTEWLVEYTQFKEMILAGCSLGRYANGLQMADAIIADLGGYERLATLFAKMGILDDTIRGLLEREG